MSQQDHHYQVLARTQRPKKFSELLGQPVLVRTLKNAFETKQIPHAFIFSGIRGVGKTTTARLVARALNCTGSDGQGTMTLEPCGECPSCTALATDSHLDVIEIDAASRTGVEDMRELTEGVAYKPVMGRYKVYIVDEVHMLSKSAFNALLKTLEEPPEHVKFIFATTEIKKVPPTIISRCQRFDLKRFEDQEIIDYFSKLLEKKQLSTEPQALQKIARVSEGSLRDALSLLEQALLFSEGTLTEKSVCEMLGLGDPDDLLALFSALIYGKTQETLTQARRLCQNGLEPEMLIQDLLRLTHEFLMFFVDQPTPCVDTRHKDLISNLSIPTLSHTWQILLKGLEEIRTSPLPFQALEVVLIRLIYAQELLDPSQPTDVPQPVTKQTKKWQTLEELIHWCETKKEPLLAAYLKDKARVLEFAPPKLVFAAQTEVDQQALTKLRQFLTNTTSENWAIHLEKTADAPPPLAEQKKAELNHFIQNNQDIQKVLEVFPGSKVEII